MASKPDVVIPKYLSGAVTYHHDGRGWVMSDEDGYRGALVSDSDEIWIRARFAELLDAVASRSQDGAGAGLSRDADDLESADLVLRQAGYGALADRLALTASSPSEGTINPELKVGTSKPDLQVPPPRSSEGEETACCCGHPEAGHMPGGACIRANDGISCSCEKYAAPNDSRRAIE